MPVMLIKNTFDADDSCALFTEIFDYFVHMSGAVHVFHVWGLGFFPNPVKDYTLVIQFF